MNHLIMQAKAAYPEAQAQDSRNRPATEMEGMLENLKIALSGLLVNAREIYCRVIPPSPQPASGDKVSPVATTYAQKLHEAHEMVDQIGAMLSELNGRI